MYGSRTVPWDIESLFDQLRNGLQIKRAKNISLHDHLARKSFSVRYWSQLCKTAWAFQFLEPKKKIHFRQNYSMLEKYICEFILTANCALETYGTWRSTAFVEHTRMVKISKNRKLQQLLVINDFKRRSLNERKGIFLRFCAGVTKYIRYKALWLWISKLAAYINSNLEVNKER